MRTIVKSAIGRTIATAALAAGLPVLAHAATIGNSYHAIQYDYRDFYAATDNKPFRVVLQGNPYPNLEPGEVARRLLPVMQANKPEPRLTFTYATPAEPQYPDYRLVLVFNPANDLNSAEVCRGVSRLRPGTPERIYVYGVYCRNDQAMAEATGWTTSSAPEDAAMGDLMKDLFNVVFSRSPYLQQQDSGHAHGR
ncbi:hypothetical protein SAMN02745126_02806 [Enhydrobacter aerosaccus]|uniref:Uncharacterized protein n=2 Tax=Enhydrobacter aerosaccus TaxID=225324 RepID=A0A1T4PGN5_9HYPH|nr:hypothetical protein SAMN02745126_02806 [Enhydrobacter aerosaccus]